MASTERVARVLVFVLLVGFGMFFVGPLLTAVVVLAFLGLVALERAGRSR